MNLQQLLSYDDYKDGLKALYSTFDLELSKEPVERLLVDNNNIHLLNNYGWDLSQLWDLDRSIVVFLLPRLYVFYKTDDTLDEEFKEGKFSFILETMLEGFMLLLLKYTNKYNPSGSFVVYNEAKIMEAFMLLGKYAQRLWN
jgi:hypothetical protein